MIYTREHIRHMENMIIERWENTGDTYERLSDYGVYKIVDMVESCGFDDRYAHFLMCMILDIINEKRS